MIRFMYLLCKDVFLLYLLLSPVHFFHFLPVFIHSSYWLWSHAISLSMRLMEPTWCPILLPAYKLNFLFPRNCNTREMQYVNCCDILVTIYARIVGHITYIHRTQNCLFENILLRFGIIQAAWLKENRDQQMLRISLVS